MYLQALISLCIVGVTLVAINLLYIFLQKRKYILKNNKSKTKNGKNNSARSMKEISNQVKSNFIKTVLQTKTMQALLIVDGLFFTAILVLIAVPEETDFIQRAGKGGALMIVHSYERYCLSINILDSEFKAFDNN